MAKKKSGKTVTEFMVGRYGYDKLSQFLIVLAMILLVGTVLMQSVFGLWAQSKYMYIVAIVVLALGYYRMGSKNIKKRKKENEMYLTFMSKFSKKALAQLEREKRVRKYATFEAYKELGEDGESVYHCYRCRNCGYEQRFEDGLGVIKIQCPNCDNSLVDRT